MIKSNIGSNIKTFRKAAGMTQNDLAKHISVSRPTISSWEINRTEPTMPDVQRMALALDCSVYEILGDYTDQIISDHNIQQIMNLSQQLTKEQQKMIIEQLEFMLWKKREKDTQITMA